METSDLFVQQSPCERWLTWSRLSLPAFPQLRTWPSTRPSTWLGSGVQQNNGSRLCVLLEWWGRAVHVL